VRNVHVRTACETYTNFVHLPLVLTSTSCQLLYGRLSDIWSRKVLLVIGIGVFFFGSLASSLAQTSLQLIVFRAFTGVGGGGIMTVAQMVCVGIRSAHAMATDHAIFDLEDRE
jgi:MFS family permease